MRMFVMWVALLFCWSAPAAVPHEALEAMVDRDVVIVRSDGSEVPGALVGVGDTTVTVMKADGRVVSVPKADIDELRGATAAPAPPRPAQQGPATPLPPAPVLPARGGDGRLVGALYRSQSVTLFGPDGRPLPALGAFRTGKQWRGYRFVDDMGVQLSQRDGWARMGDPSGYRRMSASAVTVPLSIVTWVCAIYAIAAQLDNKPGNDRWVLPVAVVGLGASITGNLIGQSAKKRRGIEGLRRAQAYYAR